MALQCMPLYFSEALGQAHAKGATDLDFLILVATSGDTGVAALNGFADRAHTRICVFYPDAGVSALQELQMVTQPGDNLTVFRLGGDFDDCQSSVKAVFDDAAFAAELAERHGLALCSANSINWGRLLPQIVYYMSALRRPGGPRRRRRRRAARRLRAHRQLRQHPRRLLRQAHGRAHRPPALRQQQQQRALRLHLERACTTSPRARWSRPRRRPWTSSSRPTWSACCTTCAATRRASAAGWRELKAPGRFEVDEATRAKLRAALRRRPGWTTTPACRTIGRVQREHGYLLDPHTAVAWEAAERLGGDAPVLIVSTAHWSKFAADVVRGLTGMPAGAPVPGAADDLELLDRVAELAPGATVPPQLRAVRARPRRFDARVEAGREPVEASLREWLAGA